MDSNLDDIETVWYVLYTKPRHEKKLSEQLNSMGIENYCPTIIKTSRWTDRIKKVEIPLIGSHIFVKIESEKRGHVFISPSAVRYLFWNGRPAIVRASEIEQIKEVLKGKSIQSADIQQYRAGQTMEVSAGPFLGVSGQIQSISKHTVTLVLKEMGVILTLHA